MHKDIIIIGAGAAGIGMGVVLKKMELDFFILEQGEIGQSFKNWPPGTRLLSPSFTGNFFGSPDLNAVCPDTSPAYLFSTEHPSGDQYAKYLESLWNFYDLPVAEKTKVTSLEKREEKFFLETTRGEFTANFVIWAGGEYQFPKTKTFEGSEFAIHNTHVTDWASLRGDEFAIVGGYESGFDTAIQLAKLGKKSVIFDSDDNLQPEKSDSSYSLSPYTKDRFREYQQYITVNPHTRITEIIREDDSYTLYSEDGAEFSFESQPILATGFETSLTQVEEYFDWDDSNPQLTDNDESTKVENFFLIGPQVKHKQVIFCFIYKFRQRFAIVAREIAEKMDMSDMEAVKETLLDYQNRNFFLEDLSCCDNECVC